MKILSKLGVDLDIRSIWSPGLAGLYLDYICKGADWVITGTLKVGGKEYHFREIFDSSKVGLQMMLALISDNCRKQFMLR